MENLPQTTEVCPHCGGAGFVVLNVPVGDPRFGKAVPCICKRKDIRDARLERMRKMMNLVHLKEMTFETFSPEGQGAPIVSFSLQAALDTARQYAASAKGWLLFTGPYGTGKTHLASAIANQRIDHGLPALFVVVPDLLDYLRGAFAPSSAITYDERFEQVRNVEMLILDDLGTQNATPWAAEKLYQILNYRYNAELPTVITTNQRIEDMDPRLASRLSDRRLVEIIRIFATDHRARRDGEPLGAKGDVFGSMNLYRGHTFDTFSPRRNEIEPSQSRKLGTIVRTVREYAEMPANWLVLRGSYGVGKTHLAAAAANKVSSSGMDALFVVVADLLDHLRATFQPGSSVSYDQRFNEVRRVQFLVLDDLGTQNATPWAEEKLFQLLNHRYVARLATVITISNDGWDRLNPRLQSRLEDGTICTLVDIAVPSYHGIPPSSHKPPLRTTRRRT